MQVLESLKTKETISEKEIKLIARRLNNGKYSYQDVEFIADLDLEVENDKKMKNISFLYDNKEYLKNREISILESSDLKCYFDGFNQLGTNQYYYTGYRFSGNGMCFSYTLKLGEIYIYG